MSDHLTDIASDLSAFHGIRDAEEMEFSVFCALAYRLPAYQGVMAAVAARQRQEQGSGGAGRRAAPGERYERSSPAANNARTADSAPPATGATFAALNAQLGSTWFSHRTVKAGEVTADG